MMLLCYIANLTHICLLLRLRIDLNGKVMFTLLYSKMLQINLRNVSRGYREQMSTKGVGRFSFAVIYCLSRDYILELLL